MKTSSGSVMRWNWFSPQGNRRFRLETMLDKDGSLLAKAPGGGWEFRSGLPGRCRRDGAADPAAGPLLTPLSGFQASVRSPGGPGRRSCVRRPRARIALIRRAQGAAQPVRPGRLNRSQIHCSNAAP